jgi:hypothetical protein
LNIALFHFHVTQIKRSAGQSAVAAAAYRAGEKLHSEYYGEISDYTRKGGVICSEILLPSHAPPEYADRETLWNAVEKAERGKKAQLAYSFDIALQNEFSMQENIDIARQFLLDNFVNRGMVADFAVHQPDKEDGGISNPHFHVMCPIRPIGPDGRWGNKQRREYVLDEHGERVLDEAGNYVFNAVPTTDWGKPETLEAWRQAWAEMCNAKFAEKGLDCRIDHRSFARQGVEQIPTRHEGPTVRAMEAKGIRTDKGNLNRFIRKTNALLREAKEKIAALIGWLKDVKAELAKPQPPMLNDLLALHCANRNKGAYSNKAKNANLQRYAEAFSFLQSKDLYTVDDLETTLHAMQDKIDMLKKAASTKQARIKEVNELLRMVDYYKSGKSAADKLKFIRFEKSRQKYKAEHDDELRTFYMAERKLKPYFKDGKLPITAWRREREQLEQDCKDIQTELSPLHADVKRLWARLFVRRKILSRAAKNSIRSTIKEDFKMELNWKEDKNRVRKLAKRLLGDTLPNGEPVRSLILLDDTSRAELQRWANMSDAEYAAAQCSGDSIRIDVEDVIRQLEETYALDPQLLDDLFSGIDAADLELYAEIEAMGKDSDHDEPTEYFFSNPDPYFKPEPLPPDRPRHNFWFDEDWTYPCEKSICFLAAGVHFAA